MMVWIPPNGGCPEGRGITKSTKFSLYINKTYIAIYKTFFSDFNTKYLYIAIKPLHFLLTFWGYLDTMVWRYKVWI